MASVELGTGHIPVRPDLRAFGQQLQKQVGPALRSAGQQISRAGSTLTRRVTLPVIGAFGVAFKAASDLNESVNKVGVVFRQNAPEIERFAKTAADSLGISRQEALEAAGTFGNLFTAMKIGIGTSTDMSKRLVTLAADLASFNNASPEEALLALRSGLVGEIEPLRKFGVNLNQVRITEEAVRLGIAKQGEVLDAAQKAQAAYSLILADTTTAQGDFERTSEGAANKMRTLRAKALDLAAGFGTRLLPIGIKILKFGENLLDRFQKLSPATQDLVVKGLALAAALGPVLLVVGKLTSGVGLLVGGVGKLSRTFNLSGLATAAWGIAIVAAVDAAIRLHNYLKMDEEQAAKWASGIDKGTVSVAKVREELDRLKNDQTGFNLADMWDGDNKAIAALEETLEISNRTFNKHVAVLLESHSAGERWSQMLRASGPMTLRQKERLAALLAVQGRYNVPLSESSRITLESYLRTGDYASALHLLQRALGGVLGPLKNALTYTEKQAEAAGDAAQKNARYAYWLKQVGGASAGLASGATRVGFVPPGAGGQTQHGGITTRFQVRTVHEAGREGILPLEGAAGRRMFRMLAEAGGGGGGSIKIIEGTLSLDREGKILLRGLAREELAAERAFDARLARRRAAE